MSFRLMAKALDIKTGSCATKMVLLKLCDYANEDNGECWPSMQTMADQCELDKSTIKRHIKKLVELGLVTSKPRMTDTGNTSNLYRVTLGAECTPPGCTVNPKPIIEPINKDKHISSKVPSTYTLFNSLKNPNKVTRNKYKHFINYLNIHNNHWKQKHKAYSKERIRECEYFLLTICDYMKLSEYDLIEYIEAYQDNKVNRGSDRLCIIFCHWLYSEIAEADYRGWGADDKKLSLAELTAEMIETMESE